jgi:hypothetical protein
MRLAFLALALTVPAASSALPAAPPTSPETGQRLAQSGAPARICGDELRVRPVRSPQPAKPRRLGDLPPGDLTLTVLNRVGECIEPVTVRQGYGLGGR